MPTEYDDLAKDNGWKPVSPSTKEQDDLFRRSQEAGAPALDKAIANGKKMTSTDYTPPSPEVPSVSVDHAKAHQDGMREGIAKFIMTMGSGAAGAQAFAQRQQPGQLQLNSKTQGQMAGMGMPVQQGQLPQPQPGQPPSMQQYMAQKQAVAQALQPQTGANSPTTLNPEQYTQTQLQNLESRKDITKEQANIAGAEANETADIQTQAAADQAKRQSEMEAFQQKAYSDGQERDNALHAQIQDMGSEKNQIHPDHWWNSKSTGGKIESSIGMFLMRLGNPKIAEDHMNHAIDADINAQQSNIDNSWKQIQAQHGLDDSAANRNNHALEWKNQFRIGSLEVVKQKLAAAAARYKNPMTQQNALMAIADIDKEKDKIRNDNWMLRQKNLAAQNAGQGAAKIALQKRLDEQHKEYSAHYTSMTDPNTGGRSETQAHNELARLYPELVQYGIVQGGTAGMSTEVPVSKADKNAARAEEKDMETRAVKLPDGSIALASDAAAKKDYESRMEATQAWMKKFERVKELQTKWEQGKLTTQDAGEWNALNGDMTNNINATVAVTRTTTDPEGKRMNDLILPEVPGWLGRSFTVGDGGSNRGKIKAIEQFMPEKMHAAMADLTPLHGKIGDKVGEPGTAPSNITDLPAWMKPKETPSSGHGPQAIQNYQNTPGLGEPTIPSYQQYRQGK